MSNIFTKSERFKSEYSCAVVRIGKLTPIEGSDFLAKTNVFGVQIVVRKDQTKEGDLVLYAAHETQLNETFLSANNLFEIGCREKNSNAAEVEAIMAEYAPMKAEADKLREQAKVIKNTMEQMAKRAKKIEKEAKKTSNQELQKQADELYQKSFEKTTEYTNLKRQVEELVNKGKPIIDRAKALCGFFNKYGRVRCVTLKGENSFGFIFSPESLMKWDSNITLKDIEDYCGQEFDTVNGTLFCKAFIPPIQPTKERTKSTKREKLVKRFDRIVEGEFAFHYDTSQFEKNIKLFKPDDVVDISVKKHGTSAIVAKVKTKVPKKLPIHKRFWNWVVDTFNVFKNTRIIDYTIEYGPVYASRTVIKNKYLNREVGAGYYSSDIWSEYSDIIYPYLEEGMTVYGEICGYITNSDKMIQKAYDYGSNRGENTFMPYRITTEEEGKKREWEIGEVEVWTNKLRDKMLKDSNPNVDKIAIINILYTGTLKDLYPDLDTENHWHENLLEKMKNDKEHFGMEENEPLCHNKVPREGICIRKFQDFLRECFKLKTQSFKLKEALQYDEGEVDIEAAQQ